MRLHKSEISLIRTDSSNKDFQALVKLLDAELKEFDGEEHDFYNQYNKIENIRHVVVAYTVGKPVGCGTIKEYSPDTAEVKRMYVDTDVRGKGLGRDILKELEKWAGELNYKYVILETGKRQDRAVALYTNSGYEIIPNYGQYAGIENSICFKKELNENFIP